MSKKHYPDVSPNPNFPEIEEKILDFWKSDAVFKESVEARTGEEFVFYDGPPFANGLPHYGHLLTGFVKDAFARYQTMTGKKVERRFGWDCHGLPAEMGSEKELGISGRAAIAGYGIDKFNEHCRTNVMKYADEWENYVTRQARWVDFKNDYKTMDINFMESVLWAFKQLYDKGLVFEAHRVMPYSWAAETPLSNFETKLDNSYREREDKAITVAFELNEAPKGAPKADKYYILAWTTTPWTLPSNLALGIGDSVKYNYIEKDGNGYILAENANVKYAQFLMSTNEDGVEEFKNKTEIELNSLINLTYKPLFPYFANHKNAFRILDGSSFVTDGDGTGIVHLAPAFGEDDQKCCEKNGIEQVCPVDGQGKYTDEIFDLENPRESGDLEPHGTPPHPTPLPEGEGVLSLKGLNVIAENVANFKFGEANERIITWLKNTGKLIKQEQIKHNYPHCWRTDQPLIYRAMPSWYVEVTKFRDRAVELNKQINWIPEHIRDGQMGHMLATAPDWSISRNRFWGTPIPVWRSKSGKIIVFGSIKEIEEAWNNSETSRSSEPSAGGAVPHVSAAGAQRGQYKKVTDLHRPYIDEIIITKDGEEYKRVEDVFDCWFESGSMPFAQVHYPFENKQWFEEHFPADFITEYVGQTRGWFNTLIMLSTALFDKIPFKNCICHGVVLDSETGLKYSKRLKNYKDPLETIGKFGADALRFLMLSSPVMRGLDLTVDPEGKFIRDVVRLAIKPVWNAYNFFTLYANADSIAASDQRSAVSDNVMDIYVLAKCEQAVTDIKKAMDSYDSPAACEAVNRFFEVLNNWYIRRNKERFWKSEHDADKQAAYDTLYTVLVTMCKAAAPLLPLTCEEIYKGLTNEKSVHLTDFPTCRPALVAGSGEDVVAKMEWAQDVCNTALSIRNKLNIRVRQPLAALQCVGKQFRIGSLLTIICDEVNVKKLITDETDDINKYADLKLSINSAVLGKRLPTLMKQILPASKKGEWKRLSGGEVEICGEVLLPSEYNLQLEPKPAFKDKAAALSTNDGLVILDTEITPELEAEGIARDTVRMIQQARKDANLNVSDRILLHIVADNKISAAITAHKDYICEQTLTEKLLDNAPEKPLYSSESELENSKITLSLLVA